MYQLIPNDDGSLTFSILGQIVNEEIILNITSQFNSEQPGPIVLLINIGKLIEVEQVAHHIFHCDAIQSIILNGVDVDTAGLKALQTHSLSSAIDKPLTIRSIRTDGEYSKHPLLCSVFASMSEYKKVRMIEHQDAAFTLSYNQIIANMACIRYKLSISKPKSNEDAEYQSLVNEIDSTHVALISLIDKYPENKVLLNQCLYELTELKGPQDTEYGLSYHQLLSSYTITKINLLLLNKTRMEVGQHPERSDELFDLLQNLEVEVNQFQEKVDQGMSDNELRKAAQKLVVMCQALCVGGTHYLMYSHAKKYDHVKYVIDFYQRNQISLSKALYNLQKKLDSLKPSIHFYDELIAAFGLHIRTVTAPNAYSIASGTSFVLLSNLLSSKIPIAYRCYLLYLVISTSRIYGLDYYEEIWQRFAKTIDELYREIQNERDNRPTHVSMHTKHERMYMELLSSHITLKKLTDIDKDKRGDLKASIEKPVRVINKISNAFLAKNVASYQNGSHRIHDVLYDCANTISHIINAYLEQFAPIISDFFEDYLRFLKQPIQHEPLFYTDRWDENHREACVHYSEYTGAIFNNLMTKLNDIRNGLNEYINSQKSTFGYKRLLESANFLDALIEKTCYAFKGKILELCYDTNYASLYPDHNTTLLYVDAIIDEIEADTEARAKAIDDAEAREILLFTVKPQSSKGNQAKPKAQRKQAANRKKKQAKKKGTGAKNKKKCNPRSEQSREQSSNTKAQNHEPSQHEKIAAVIEKPFKLFQQRKLDTCIDTINNQLEQYKSHIELQINLLDLKIEALSIQAKDFAEVRARVPAIKIYKILLETIQENYHLCTQSNTHLSDKTEYLDRLVKLKLDASDSLATLENTKRKKSPVKKYNSEIPALDSLISQRNAGQHQSLECIYKSYNDKLFAGEDNSAFWLTYWTDCNDFTKCLYILERIPDEFAFSLSVLVAKSYYFAWFGFEESYKNTIKIIENSFVLNSALYETLAKQSLKTNQLDHHEYFMHKSGLKKIALQEHFPNAIEQLPEIKNRKDLAEIKHYFLAHPKNLLLLQSMEFNLSHESLLSLHKTITDFYGAGNIYAAQAAQILSSKIKLTATRTANIVNVISHSTMGAEVKFTQNIHEFFGAINSYKPEEIYLYGSLPLRIFLQSQQHANPWSKFADIDLMIVAPHKHQIIEHIRQLYPDMYASGHIKDLYRVSIDGIDIDIKLLSNKYELIAAGYQLDISVKTLMCRVLLSKSSLQLKYHDYFRVRNDLCKLMIDYVNPRYLTDNPKAILNCLRTHAEYNLPISPQAIELTHAHIKNIRTLPTSALRGIVIRSFMQGFAEKAFDTWLSFGVLDQLFDNFPAEVNQDTLAYVIAAFKYVDKAVNAKSVASTNLFTLTYILSLLTLAIEKISQDNRCLDSQSTVEQVNSLHSYHRERMRSGCEFFQPENSKTNTNQVMSKRLSQK